MEEIGNTFGLRFKHAVMIKIWYHFKPYKAAIFAWRVVSCEMSAIFAYREAKRTSKKKFKERFEPLIIEQMKK